MLAVFIEFKRRRQGHVRLSTVEIKRLCKTLGISMPTFYKCRNELIKLNWIGYNKAKKLYHVRSWNFVLKVTQLQGKSNVEGHIDDLKNFKAFCWAADVMHYTKVREHKARPKNAGRKQIAKAKDNHNVSPLSAPEKSEPNKLGVVLLGERYGVAKSTISRWKKKAKKKGYLNYEHNFARLGVPIAHLDHVRQAYSELAHRIVAIGNSCYLQLTDTFTSDFRFYSTRW